MFATSALLWNRSANHPDTRPGQPVQGSGYLVIWESASPTSNDLDRFQAGTPVVLAGGIPLDAQFRVLAAGPVNQQNDLLVILIYVRVQARVGFFAARNPSPYVSFSINATRPAISSPGDSSGSISINSMGKARLCGRSTRRLALKSR